MNPAEATEGPRIYNLFPLLAGKMREWEPHLERARKMGFNWVFVNPFHLPGLSGSLYAVKDYYDFHPLLIDPEGGSPTEQLRRVIQSTHRLGMKIMMDLVINHTAIDSPLVEEHPEWYERGSEGQVVNPGAWDNGRWVSWGDLAAINNADSPNRENLWQYWKRLVCHYAGLGFDGFRCDAAYQVPADLWRFLIGSGRKDYPRLKFFAESLGCTIDQTLQLAEVSFDFVYNSSKWWDFSEPWCLDQYRQSAPVVASISFPESHDTERLAAELNGDREAVRQRYVFAAFFATGVMIPVGFEYGFRRRLHVVETRPHHWEEPSWDETEFITQVNSLKSRFRLWNEEGPVESLEAGNAAVLALRKFSRDGRQRSLLLFNKDKHAPQSCRLPKLGDLLGETGMEIFPDSRPLSTDAFKEIPLPPAGVQIFLTP